MSTCKYWALIMHICSSSISNRKWSNRNDSYFNGMTSFHHREPGLVGAAMRFRDIFGEVICDGNHSTYEALNDLLWQKKKIIQSW